MKPNFVCDYGINIHLGDNFYSNWNLTMLDVCPITIGKMHCLTNCQLLTPLHPLDAQERISGIEYGAPIIIGDNLGGWRCNDFTWSNIRRQCRRWSRLGCYQILW